MPELEAILEAYRKQKHEDRKFMAALKGVDLDDGQTDAKEKFDEVQRRVQAKLTGESEQKLELDVFGLDIETEDE